MVESIPEETPKARQFDAKPGTAAGPTGAAAERGVKHIRLTQLDGSLPNLALMKLSHWHKAQGHHVTITRQIERDLFEPSYDRVYGSAIFHFSQERVMRFQMQWPEAIVGGTGTLFSHTVEDLIGAEYEHYDYTDYDVDYSMGFTQRGCRLACKFCEVPKKEGKPRSVNSIADIWRGAPWPKKLHLLDNDFFGNPEWPERIKEIRDGGFKVCFSQGINLRTPHFQQDHAEAIASIQYRDTKFSERRLYTAWDNLKDEERFFDGVAMLESAGVPAKHLMTYMLIGFDKAETWDRIWHRFHRMVERGIMPYPMVFDRSRKDLLAFQRWVVTGLYRIVPWDEYQRETKSAESVAAYMHLQDVV